ncbi:hypothetical protein TNCV_1140041 [Trichonephila clavipes]|nr:hypothetical protein TNCV_1140041 [Trichonephila clavipes]
MQREASFLFEDTELESLLDQDSCLTQEELIEMLGVIQQAIPNYLKVMGMIQRKEGKCVPYEFKQRDLKCRFFMC